MLAKSKRRGRGVALALAAWLASSCLSAQHGRTENPNAAELKEGDAAIARGDYAAAVSIGDSILAQAPNDRDALNLVYRAKLAELETRRARADREKAVSREKGMVAADCRRKRRCSTVP
jgi:hypothetical protein